MQWLSSLLLPIQILTSLAIIVLVLLQQGKGADMGSSFGGGSAGSVFGSAGAANFLSRTTRWVAIVFFIVTIGLAYNSHNTGDSILDGGLMQDYQPSAPSGAPNGAVPSVPGAGSAVPQAPAPAPAGEVPAAPQAPSNEVPAAPGANDAPAPSSDNAPAASAPSTPEDPIVPSTPEAPNASDIPAPAAEPAQPEVNNDAPTGNGQTSN